MSAAQRRTSVLRSKTSAQAEFTSAEHFNLSGLPKRPRPFWEVDAPSEVTQAQLDGLHIALVKPEE